MHLGVMSDTHTSRGAVRLAVSRAGQMDAWLHAGDVVSDALYLEEYTGLPVHFVRGNCDFESDGESERILTLSGVRILLLHGNRYGVNSGLYRLSLHARECECQVVVFGHTHKSLLENDGGVLLLNPGSPALPRGCAPSAAVLTVENGRASAEILTL